MMDNFIPNPNSQVIFHPINEERQAIADNKRDLDSNKRDIDETKRDIDETKRDVADNKKVIEHVATHYRKYLFGLGAVCGFIISLAARVVFGTSTTSVKTLAGFETPASVGNTAIIIFDQMDAIAHQKDNFFHQTGKIYTLSGAILFNRYDTIFHVLDNAYHRSVNMNDKLKRADKLERFWKAQDALFASTLYVNPEQDKIFAQLDAGFVSALSGINLNVFSGVNVNTLETNPGI